MGVRQFCPSFPGCFGISGFLDFQQSDFCICSCIYLYQRSLYLPMGSTCCLKLFYFHLKDILFFVGEVCGQEFYQILFIQKCLISLIFTSKMKDSFAGYRILSWQHSSFSSLNIPSHSLQTSKVSGVKSTGDLPEDPLHMITHFSLAAFKILSLPLSFDNFISVFQCDYLWVYSTWSLLNFLGLHNFMSLIQFGKMFTSFLQMLFLSLSLSCLFLGLPQFLRWLAWDCRTHHWFCLSFRVIFHPTESLRYSQIFPEHTSFLGMHMVF